MLALAKVAAAAAPHSSAIGDSALLLLASGASGLVSPHRRAASGVQHEGVSVAYTTSVLHHRARGSPQPMHPISLALCPVRAPTLLMLSAGGQRSQDGCRSSAPHLLAGGKSAATCRPCGNLGSQAACVRRPSAEARRLSPSRAAIRALGCLPQSCTAVCALASNNQV